MFPVLLWYQVVSLLPVDDWKFVKLHDILISTYWQYCITSLSVVRAVRDGHSTAASCCLSSTSACVDCRQLHDPVFQCKRVNEYCGRHFLEMDFLEYDGALHLSQVLFVGHWSKSRYSLVHIAYGCEQGEKIQWKLLWGPSNLLD